MYEVTKLSYKKGSKVRSSLWVILDLFQGWEGCGANTFALRYPGKKLTLSACMCREQRVSPPCIVLENSHMPKAVMIR